MGSGREDLNLRAHSSRSLSDAQHRTVAVIDEVEFACGVLAERANRRIRMIQSVALVGSPFLDITSKVESGGEKGLLGLAFHPNFSSNRRFFINYTRRLGSQLQSIISEYAGSTSNPNQADASSERILLTVDQPFDNHNGGQLAFGPDGFLYIALGDGGSEGDPQGNGQNLQTLLGKILRIDVDSAFAAGKQYATPADNPFTPPGRLT